MNPVEFLAANYGGSAIADGVWLFPAPESAATFARMVRGLERDAGTAYAKSADWKAWSHDRVAGASHTSCDGHRCWCDE